MIHESCEGCEGLTMEALHPVAVHFPLVLILLWPMIDAVGVWTKSRALSLLAVVLLGATVIVSLFATVSGQAAYDAALEQGHARAILDLHADVANFVPWLLLAVFGIRLGGAARFGLRGRFLGITAGILLWPVAYQVGATGGTLVYRHGVGVSSEGRLDRAPSVKD